MPLEADPKYPSRRAYVVTFRSDATPHALAGRIENLVTGRQLAFKSGSDLLGCFVRDLLEHLNESPADRPGDDQ